MTTMMKPKAADSPAPQSIMTYFSPKMPLEMGNNQGTKKHKLEQPENNQT